MGGSKGILVTCLLLTAAFMSAQAKQPPPRYAMLFCITGVTLEDFQGGAGVAMALSPLMKVRAAADLRYKDTNVNPDEFDVGVTGVFEYHLLKGQVSPYFGGFLGYLLELDRNTIDAANWTGATDNIFSAGPLVGVEFFVLDNLSFFAEYELAFLLTLPSASVCTNGVVTDTPQNMEFLMDARLGNGAKLGITVYF